MRKNTATTHPVIYIDIGKLVSQKALPETHIAFENGWWKMSCYC